MIYLGKLKIKISDTEWKEITELDELTIKQLTVNTKLQTDVTPSSDNDVINKNYLDAQIEILNNTIAESGGLYVANSNDLTETNGIPSEEQNNKLWIDTNTETGGLKYYNGSTWVYVPVAFS